MEKAYTKNNPFNIIFVGRLEKEKGIEILIECIKKTMIHEVFGENICWHIIGAGEYDFEIKNLAKKFDKKVILYGQRSREFIVALMPQMDLSIIPSLFIETFGLVALESLMQNVPVSGFKKGGLSPFISDMLALDEDDPANSFLRILTRIMKYGFPEKPSLDLYSISLWREELKLIVRDRKRILMINDYLTKVGGAEVYIGLLREELLALGKEVKIVGYDGAVPKWKRIILGILSPFLFWHKNWLQKEIQNYNPDAIWMHNIGRFIGPWGLAGVIRSGKYSIITHHDLGLLTARPSRITKESELPTGLNIKSFLNGTFSPLEIIARTGKYIILFFFWKYLKHIDIHLVPSEFMQKVLERFGTKQVEVFPHSIR